MTWRLSTETILYLICDHRRAFSVHVDNYTIAGKNAPNTAKMAGKLRIRPITDERLKREAESLRNKGEQAVSDADYRRLFQNVPTLDDDALRDLFVDSTPIDSLSVMKDALQEAIDRKDIKTAARLAEMLNNATKPLL